MIVAIDGPAGAGKSTVAKLLAEKLRFLYIDTGAMYRALTLKAIETGVSFSDINGLILLAQSTQLRLEKANINSETIILLDGRNVSEEIRLPEVTNSVFHLAGISQVRKLMVHWQREYGVGNDIVMEGRDIGTVVFPEAEKKVYLDASVNIRAKRRYEELKVKNMDINMDDLIVQIKDRDYKDKSRFCGPLKMAQDAFYLDSSVLCIEEVVNRIFAYVKS
ncbi:MAG: (d)CMP kinase [Candidatus Omnitrophica bacterium]|nr:(d)CMP kinase [Candidatus Omnitrophota bacterium]